MVFNLLALFIVGGCSLIIGSAFLTKIDPEKRIARPGDRAIIAVWLGILLLLNLFLGVALFLPLSPLVAGCTVLPAIIISLWAKKNRAFVQKLVHFQRLKLFEVAVPMVFVSIAGTQVIHWYDSGLYHIQVIKWLSEFGLVPGLALIHSRFGFISSWFTLAVPFNHGVLEGRVASLPGSFCMLMLLLGWTIAFFRIMGNEGRGQDWFLLAASSLATPLIILRWIAPSPSPDLPVMVLVVFVGWTIFAVADAWRQGPQDNEKILHIGILPLILSAGAVTIKLSAFPLLAVSFVYYLFGRQPRLRIKNFMAAIAATFAIMAPLAAAGIITSGCAFYPAPYFCANLPWSLGHEQALRESRIIREWAEWNGPTPDGAASWSWLGSWLRTDKILVALIVLTLVAAAIVLIGSPKRFRDRDGYIISIGILGTAFMFFTAPTWRFGLGYLFVIPALAVAVLQNRYSNRLQVSFLAMRSVVALYLTGMLAIFLAPSYIISGYSHSQIAKTEKENGSPSGMSDRFNFFIPPATWDMEYDRDSNTGNIICTPMILEKEYINNITYYHSSDGETCWDAPLPCAPGKLKDIQLRNPSGGIASGFIRTPNGS